MCCVIMANVSPSSRGPPARKRRWQASSRSACAQKMLARASCLPDVAQRVIGRTGEQSWSLAPKGQESPQAACHRKRTYLTSVAMTRWPVSHAPIPYYPGRRVERQANSSDLAQCCASTLQIFSGRCVRSTRSDTAPCDFYLDGPCEPAHSPIPSPLDAAGAPYAALLPA
jgi:hypothetical protein